ncbi:hypothetical protein [Yersinia enterocolitica]|uniref:hypothetical protein n=1 Tax=Yersinia enterocolitica TaxID=630 RepID=UPI003F45D2E2
MNKNKKNTLICIDELNGIPPVYQAQESCHKNGEIVVVTEVCEWIFVVIDKVVILRLVGINTLHTRDNMINLIIY